MANFKTVPANKIDPPNGAEVCALGNHICTGIRGVFTANAKKKAAHNII